MINNLSTQIDESIKTKKSLLKLSKDIEKIIKIIYKKINSQGKILICGNGGSAADAQHLVAEFVVRLRPHINRNPIAAMSLVGDTSTITACGNDFGYEKLYERMITSLGKEGDCLIGITTSGNSENIILAMRAAKKMGINVFGFLGSGGGDVLELCDENFLVPSNDTGRIQEAHITAGHALMEYVEDKLLECEYLHLQG